MTAEIGVLADSRAVLIGVSAYEHAEFRPIRAARNSLQAMYALLSDPALCGWPPERITVIRDPASAAGLADVVADLAESATGVLLLYYVGHGVLSARGELCLTVSSTRPNRPKITGLPWDIIADVLRVCPATARLTILDCCFAGQAIEALSADGEPSLADIAHTEGVYTLTATARNRTAHVPPPGQQDTACTSFTGELRELIQAGIPGRPPWLTFGDIYPVLRQRLKAKGLPTPSQRGTNTAYLFPFTANAAVRIGPDVHNVPPEGNGIGGAAQKNPEPVRANPALTSPIVTDRQRTIKSITDDNPHAPVLAGVAGALVATDPDRATRLFTDAERIAQSAIDDGYSKASALAAIAEALATTDPDRAERTAQSITVESFQASALAAIAKALAATDPNRATRLLTDAERIAQSTTDNGWPKASALAAVAGTLAATDPDRAERLLGDAYRVAQSITAESFKASALAAIAKALAAIDPDRAERIAQSMAKEYSKASALAAIAGALAATDPNRATRLFTDAERIAQSITGAGNNKSSALAAVAMALAAIDPDRAERIAQSITGGGSKAPALAAVAEALATTDPDRAERIAQSITVEYSHASALAGVAGALAAIDPDRATRLLTGAERTAQWIIDDMSRALALAQIAKAWNQG